MRRFEGRLAVVTGASRGIGKAIALRFAREGARVVLLANDSLARAVEEVSELGSEPLAISTDVASPASIEAAFDRIVRELGAPDVLVNNAGIPCFAHVTEVSDEDIDRTIATNLRGSMLCARRAAREMIAAERRGAIVQVGSVGAERAHRMMSVYDATKGALTSLTRALAVDLAPFRIRVNIVQPGPIDVGDEPAESKAVRAEPVPWGRVGTPDDVAGVVAFLCSSEAEYVTGQSIAVDGGQSAQLVPARFDYPLPGHLEARLTGRLK